MPPRKVKIEAPKSTAQQLGSIVKSSRDIKRKDKGLNGDLDRLPMLTCIANARSIPGAIGRRRPITLGEWISERQQRELCSGHYDSAIGLSRPSMPH